METLEKMRRRQKHMDNITKLMGRMEVENNLSEREWRKPAVQQRYVNNQSPPFKKGNGPAWNWRLLSHVITKSLRNLMNSKLFNNTLIKRDIFTTTNLQICSPEAAYKGVKMNWEQWQKKKDEAGLGAHAPNDTNHEIHATNNGARDNMAENQHGATSRKETMAERFTEEEEDTQARLEAAAGLITMREQRDGQGPYPVTLSMMQPGGKNTKKRAQKTERH